MFPDLLTVHRHIQTEMRLKNAELERRFARAHFQSPEPSRNGRLGTVIRRVVASLASLRPARGRHLVEERARVAVADCFEPATGQPC